MRINTVTELNSHQKSQLRELWNSEYPAHLCYASENEFNQYLSQLSTPHHYLLQNNNTILGWAFDFVRDKEKWFGLVIQRGIQSKGHGTALLDVLKKNNLFLNGWVIDHSKYLRSDGFNYISPVEFYKKNGFILVPEERIGLEKISAIKVVWKKEK